MDLLKSRHLHYVLAAAILVSLMYYSYTSHDKYYPSVSDFIKDPARYDGIVTEQQGHVESVEKDSFVFRSGNKYVDVTYSGVEMPMFGQITFVGTYKKEGYIAAERIRYNQYNYGKYAFSVVGLTILLVIFFRDWKITSRGFEDA